MLQHPLCSLLQLFTRNELTPISEELLIHYINEILFVKYKFVYMIHYTFIYMIRHAFVYNIELIRLNPKSKLINTIGNAKKEVP